MRELMRTPVTFKGLSDVILVEYKHGDYNFINMTTGKKGSKFENVIGDNNYILIRKIDIDTVVGYYTVINEEKDALILVLTKYNIKQKTWHEFSRIVFGRTEYISNTIAFSNSIDMRGQWVGNPLEPHRSTTSNMHYKGINTIREYFGPINNRQTTDKEFIIQTLFDINRLLGSMGKYYSESKFGIQSINDDGRILSDDNIPNGLKNRMGLFFKNYLNTYFDRPKDMSLPYEGAKVSYLQYDREKEAPVLRCFICTVNPVKDINKEKNIHVNLYEYKRIWMDRQFKNNNLDVLNVPLVFYDKDMESVFKYAKSALQNAANFAKKKSDKHFVIAKTAREIYILATEPFCEKVNNSPYKKLASEMKKCLASYHQNTHHTIEQYMGTINWDKKQLHQMLGVPKEVIETLENVQNVKSHEIIRHMKKMFESSPEFLAKMGHQSIETFFTMMSIPTKENGLKDKDTIHSFRTNVSNNVAKLVTVFGPDNWENFYSYINKNHRNDSRYSEYLDKLVVLREMAEGFEWKLEGDELIRADNSLQQAYYAAMDKTSYERYSKSFKEQEGNWKHYEFRKDGLMITYPKFPSELVMEGVKLNHCAKTFLDYVSERRTMVLFIRKVNNPNKPFYTLEIRNGRIRQCHGHNNINIGENPELEPFLKAFCKEKNVEFAYGGDMLGA